MKRWGIGLAVVGSAGMLLSGVLPANATADAPQQMVASSNIQSYYKTRYFDCFDGCYVSAVLPKSWRYVKLSNEEFRFSDRTAPRMIRIRMVHGGTTAVQAKHKQDALKGTRGLKVLSRKTATMRSTTHQGPLTVTTLVYTYKSGSTTRWVATRYVAQWGLKSANLELTVGGRLQDRAALAAILDNATTSITLAG